MTKQSIGILILLSLVAVGGVIYVFVSLYQWQQSSSDEETIRMRFRSAVNYVGSRMLDSVNEAGAQLTATAQYCGALADRTPPLTNSSFVRFVNGLTANSNNSTNTNTNITIIWAPAVPRADVASHQMRVRSLDKARSPITPCSRRGMAICCFRFFTLHLLYRKNQA